MGLSGEIHQIYSLDSDLWILDFLRVSGKMNVVLSLDPHTYESFCTGTLGITNRKRAGKRTRILQSNTEDMRQMSIVEKEAQLTGSYSSIHSVINSITIS